MCEFIIIINPQCMRQRGNYGAWFVCVSVTRLLSSLLVFFVHGRKLWHDLLAVNTCEVFCESSLSSVRQDDSN